jgi:hypothetical protein
MQDFPLARPFAFGLLTLAGLVALLVPWTHVEVTGLCIFPPCAPPRDEVQVGFETLGGVLAATACAVGAALVVLPGPTRRRDAAALVACGVAALAGLFHPGGVIVFGNLGAPAWGAMATMVLALAAATVLLGVGAWRVRMADARA